MLQNTLFETNYHKRIVAYGEVCVNNDRLSSYGVHVIKPRHVIVLQNIVPIIYMRYFQKQAILLIYSLGTRVNNTKTVISKIICI